MIDITLFFCKCITKKIYIESEITMFYDNKHIIAIADNPRWTVSDKNKCPIDIVSYKATNAIHGALSTTPSSLMTLADVNQTIPNATNNTYYLKSTIDKIVVLDIEPKCPIELKKQLLELPYLYGEVSLSGKGYHLLFALPECIADYPDAKYKTVMREEHGYYEILMDHYITFSRNEITQDASFLENKSKLSFDDIFKELASTQTTTTRKTINITNDIDPDSIPLFDDIMTTLLPLIYKKTIDDFHDDYSKFEYGVTGFYHHKLQILLKATKYATAHNYTDEEKSIILYEIIKTKIVFREKHTTMREQLPWLLYLAQNVISKYKDKDK